MSVGFNQLLLIVLVALVIFGAKRIPTIMTDLAKGIRAFKKGMQDADEMAKDEETAITKEHP